MNIIVSTLLLQFIFWKVSQCTRLCSSLLDLILPQTKLLIFANWIMWIFMLYWFYVWVILTSCWSFCWVTIYFYILLDITCSNITRIIITKLTRFLFLNFFNWIISLNIIRIRSRRLFWQFSDKKRSSFPKTFFSRQNLSMEIL